MRFRKKPIEIEAEQWNPGTKNPHVIELQGDDFTVGVVTITTAGGYKHAATLRPGDWIILKDGKPTDTIPDCMIQEYYDQIEDTVDPNPVKTIREKFYARREQVMEAARKVMEQHKETFKRLAQGPHHPICQCETCRPQQ